MNKIIISLFAFAISFSLMANAQVSSISVTAVKDKSVVDTTQARKRVVSEPVKANIQLKEGLETGEFKRIDQKGAVLLGDRAEIEVNGLQVKDQIKKQVKAENQLLENKETKEKQTLRKTIQNKIEATKENTIRTISQIKNKVMYDKKLTSQKAKEIIEKAREERASFVSRAKTLKENLQDKRKIEKEELQNKIQLLKDQKKRETVMRIDNNLSSLNDRFMGKWSEALNKLDEWTIKIVDKIAVESANDKDVTNANASIDKAKTAMLSARTAIENQLKKTYPVAITTEENLKSDVSAVRARLNTDLKSIKNSIQEAHKSVVSALVEFNNIIK